MIDGARTCKVERRALLKRYRWEVVRPCLLEFDGREFAKAAQTKIPVLELPFKSYQTSLCRFAPELIDALDHSSDWRAFRLWSLTRITGEWPLTVYGHMTSSKTISICYSCGVQDGDITHPICHCPTTKGAYEDLTVFPSCPPRAVWPNNLLFLFGEHNSAEERLSCIRYVGNSIHLTFHGRESKPNLSEAPAGDDRLDILLRMSTPQQENVTDWIDHASEIVTSTAP